jgi:putative membrane protein
MNTTIKEKLHDRIIWIFAIFFGVGVILFSIPATRVLFFRITPFTLVGLAAVLFAYHKTWNIKNILLFLFIFLFSFFTEMLGVKTGHLFGSYVYLTSLGVKLFDVPLIIGVNWLVLSYGAHAMTRRFLQHRFLRVILAALLMVFYDIILEVAAPIMHMWAFDIGYPPLENFVMWFVLGLIFQTGLELLKINTNNKAARSLFVVQMIFFLLISIIGHLLA